jgi:hypothetical protein
MISKELMVYVGLGVITLLGVWYVDQRAYTRGIHSRDLEVSQLNTQIAQAAVVLNQCDDNGKAQAAAAKAQRDMADAALNAATQRDQNRTKELTNAVNKLNDARKTADCKATSEAVLCPAMASY